MHIRPPQTLAPHRAELGDLRERARQISEGPRGDKYAADEMGGEEGSPPAAERPGEQGDLNQRCPRPGSGGCEGRRLLTDMLSGELHGGRREGDHPRPGDRLPLVRVAWQREASSGISWRTTTPVGDESPLLEVRRGVYTWARWSPGESPERTSSLGHDEPSQALEARRPSGLGCYVAKLLWLLLLLCFFVFSENQTTSETIRRAMDIINTSMELK